MQTNVKKYYFSEEGVKLNTVERNKRHLKRIRDAGIPWVRMDVKKPVADCEYLFREAHDLGLNIIAPVTSKGMLKGHGCARRLYLSGSGWEVKWKEQIEHAVEILRPFVDIWQVDNELNHPIHNTIPAFNRTLAVDIAREGIKALTDADPAGRISVNLFFELRGPLGFPHVHDEVLIRRFNRELGHSIDILGIDIYRDSWHRGSPVQYPGDMERVHRLWQGDIMLMETGFCTGFLGGTESQQALHVRDVFRALGNHIRNVSWFGGIVWYEYASKHTWIPCEEFFGLHRRHGFSEKPAWAAFVDEVNAFGTAGKILGITYHY